MAEEGYFALELETLVVNLANPIANETTWRIDVEIVGTYNVFKWIISNDSKYSTGNFKPVQQEGVENSYIFGFNGQFLRSNYVELNSETINGLCNATLAIKLFTINEAAGNAAPAKGKKGANEPVVAAEEILVQLSIPMSNLFTAQGSSIAIDQPIEQYMANNSAVVVGPVHASVVPSSTVFTLRAFTDNELSAYTLGSKVVRWQSALLTSPPPAWALHAADVVDPKAKVQPTPADLRAKYIENISKLVETQTKVASYTCEIGSVKQTSPEDEAGAEEQNSVSDYVLRAFAPLSLAEGRILFDADKARAVPAEEDIRVNTSIWSVAWKASGCIFFHRSAAKKLVSMVSADPSHAYLPLTIKKAPLPEFTAAEGGEVFATGLVDISPIIAPGKALVELHVGSLVGDQMEDCGTHLSIDFASNEPLRPVSELSKLASSSPSAALAKPKVPLAAENKDALQELRDEISKTIEYIAQEYVSQHPAATNNDQVDEEKKTAFLQHLLTSGIFHDLQEKIRPRVVSVIADRYGVRGRALGKSELVKQMDIEQDANYKAQLQNILSELYVFLLKECNVVLNSMFSQTMVQKQRNEVSNPARLDDEEESDLQKLHRLYRQARDRAADGRDAEDLHLERLQLIDHNLSLYNDKQLVHDVYLQYAEYLLSQATKDFDQYSTYLKKAREILLVALRQVPVWSTLLLYACILVECDQAESAEQTLHSLLNDQLAGYSLGAFDDMSGYDTDGLCPVPPRVYCVLASLFAMQKKSLLCNKALRLANRCFVESEEGSTVSQHGSPRRTLVLLLSETTLYLLQYGQYKLAQACLTLALEAEAAVVEKAKIKNKSATSPPHIRYLLKKAQVEASWGHYPVLNSSECVNVGSECALIAEDPSDQVTANLCAAKCYARAGDLENTVESYLKAISITKDKFSLSSMLKSQLLPLDSLLTVSKLLQQYGRYDEAVLVLLYASQLFSSASVCLQLGVNYLRLNKESEAEKALMEANLLDNRNAEVWAMLCMLCVRLGPRRVYEAEQCLFQALRLGLAAPSVLRELALAFMSIDKLQVAEDLLRRSIACDLQTKRSAHPHARKLLADVLAGQNLAAKAVDEYKAVLLDEDADVSTKRAAADKCLALLASLGRDEELEVVKNIAAALEGEQAQ